MCSIEQLGRARPQTALGLLLVVATLGDTSAAEAPAGRMAEAPLLVSAADDNFPYSFTDDDGRLTGFAVDLLDAVADEMHLSIERVPMSALDDLRRFGEGEFDIAQHHPRLPRKDAAVLYSSPYLVAHGAIIVRSGDRRFASIDDLREKRARIATPTQGRAYAIENGIDPELITLAASPDCLRMLVDRRVDAILVTRFTGLAQAHHLGIRGIEAVGPPLQGFTVRFCFATHADRADLLDKLEEGLAALRQSDRYAAIYEKWFSRYDRPALTPLEIAAIIAISLAGALVMAIWALLHQRALRRRIADQARELDENRAILAEAQSFAAIGHWIIAATNPDEMTWSDEVFRIFSRDPARGAPTFSEVVSWAAPAERTPWREAVEATLHRGTPHDLTVTVEPVPGNPRHLHLRGRGIVDAQGRQTGYFGTVQDITDWREAETALRRSEALLRALFDNLPPALGVVEMSSDEWRIVSLNPRAGRLFGVTLATAAGTAFSSLQLPAGSVGWWADRFLETFGSGEPCSTEIANGDRTKTFAVTVVPLRNGCDHARCCFLVEDITTRVQNEAEIARGRRLRAIGELVGGIAHEFNNLLTPVLLNCEILRSQWAHQPGLSEELDVIADAARRSADLTRRLLTFGRKTERKPEPVDLATVVEANIDLVRRSIDRRISIERALPADLPRLYLNSGDLHQIILNLLLNARDTLSDRLAGPPTEGWTASIMISARLLPTGAAAPLLGARVAPVEGWIRLELGDTGCGMPAEVIERIFEPFYTTKEIGRGTGLGLATVWHLVAELGGRIDVESSVGHGSTFYLYLPVLPAPTDAAPAAIEIAPPVTANRPRCIMMVEDEPAVARVVKAALSRHGHDVVHHADGADAWQVLAASAAAFDGVLMDMNLPGMNGCELARRLRQLPWNGPIWIMSGRLTDAEASELEQIQVNAVIHKPFSLDALHAMLDKAFASDETVPSD